MENEQFNLPDTAIEPTKMPIKKAFTIVGFALSLSIIALNIVSYIGVGLIYRYLPAVYNSDYFQFGASTIPLMLIAMPVFFGVMCLIPTVKTSYKEKLSIGMLAKITVIGYVVMIILNLVSSVLNMIISGATGLPATNPIEFIQDTGIWPVILFSVILSPIVEEIMFRYIIINKLRGYGSGVAIFTSAFAFGLYHGNLYQMLYAFAIGAVFAAVYYKTGKLIYPIILHILFNFIGGVLPLGMLSENPIYMVLCGIVLVAIMLIGFILGIITLCKIDYSKTKHYFMPRQYIKPFFLNYGMLFYIVLTLAVVMIFLLQ